MKLIVGIIIMLATISPWEACNAWGSGGHILVGEIAEEYLTTQTKTQVEKLLGGKSMGQVSYWADHVKGSSKFPLAQFLHYVNTDRHSQSIDMQRDSNRGNNLLEAIKKSLEKLSDRNASTEQRGNALKFLIHYIGDLHQPLHIGYGFDRGGNASRVTFLNGRKGNLHGMWDYGILQNYTHSQKIGTALYSVRNLPDEKFQEWNALLSVLKDEVIDSTTDKQLAEWREKNVLAWAQESFRITKKVYANYEKSKVVDQETSDHYMDIIKLQLGAGGVRLAMLVNQALEQPEEIPQADSIKVAPTRQTNH